MLSKHSRILVLFIALTAVLSAQPSVSLTGPRQIRPGHGTGFILTIRRNGISGVVRFVQDVPAGWEVTPAFNATPGVSVSEGKHKAVWLSFPLRDTVIYSYLLKVPEGNNETITLRGQLEYFENGTIRRIDVPPFTVRLRRHFSRF